MEHIRRSILLIVSNRKFEQGVKKGYVFQFGAKQGSTSSVVPKKHGNGASGDQTDNKPAETTVPEDITNFYDKMDKEDEDDEEEAVLKTVSFEVNQVCFCTLYILLLLLNPSVYLIF
jgi:DNA excision repair protein ERCC-3